MIYLFGLKSLMTNHNRTNYDKEAAKNEKSFSAALFLCINAGIFQGFLTDVLFSVLRQQPVLRRRKSGDLFKLPHIVQFALISAAAGHSVNRQIAGAQIELAAFHSRLDEIVHAGNAEIFLIERLKVGGAHPDRSGEICNRPFLVAGIQKPGAQAAEFLEMLLASGIRRYERALGVQAV